jgi:hypothetical protein
VSWYLVSKDPEARLRFARIATMASGNFGKRIGKSHNQRQQTTENKTLMTCIAYHDESQETSTPHLGSNSRRNWQFIAVTSASHSAPEHA